MKKEMENNVNEETINVEVTEEQEVETFMDKAKSGVKKYWKPAMKIVASVAVGLAVGYVMDIKTTTVFRKRSAIQSKTLQNLMELK